MPRERRSPSPWRRLRRRLAFLRPLRPYVLGLLAVLALMALWGVFRAFTLQRELNAAKSAERRVETSLRAGDAAGAREGLRVVQRHTGRAMGVVRDPVWRIGGHVPFVRLPIRTSSGVARAGDALARSVLPDLVSGVDVLGGRTVVGTRIDVTPFANARPFLDRASARLATVERDLAALPFTGVGRVDKGRDDVLRRVRSLRPAVDGAAAATALVPDLLGPGTRRFFLAVQNNAEARASGGLIGAYGIVTASDGRLALERVGSNDELPSPRTPVALDAELRARYGRLGLGDDWRSANLSPHFPTTGRVVRDMWRSATGQALDGVLAVDPVALARVLEVTGAVRLSDGTSLTSRNAVDLTLRGFYEKFPEQSSQGAKNTYLRDAARLVFARLDRGGLDARRLAERLGASAGDGHLRLWLADPARQSVLERTALAGSLPAPEAGAFSVVTQNVAGTKLDYYLRRTVTWQGAPTGEAFSVGGAPRPVERATVEVALANTAPASGLPPYVTVRPDDPGAPKGQNKVWVSVYLPAGTQLRSASVDGRAVSVESQVERGLAVLSYVVTIDPGATVTLRLDVDALVADRALRYVPQPLAFPDVVRIRR